MKKKIALLLSLSLVILSLAACGGNGDQNEEQPPVDGVTAGSVKTGMAVITSADKSKDAGAEEGLAQADSNVVAVTVDEEGRIVRCSIDSAQTKINFTADGKITTPLDTVFVAKQEMGTDYGMNKASSIGKEWNEQATALSNYVLGKTLDEIKGIAVTEEGVPTDADLSSSVTVKIGGYIDAIEKAMNNAQNLGATADDKLGVGVITTIAKSKDAGDEDGLAQAYSYYTATTFNADGVITSSIIDASQTNINFSADGKITSDINGPFQTKGELGDAYGMKGSSGIGMEWSEQADAFAQYIVGKTMDDVNGIAVNPEGVVTEEDLKSSVTVHVGDFFTILESAASSAK